MPKNDTIDAPMTLTGLFPDDDDDDNDDDDDGNNNHDDDNDNDHLKSLCYEIQQVHIVDRIYHIRQYDYHSHNANRIWPGTFALGEYILQKNVQDNQFRFQWGNILELGTATGLLSILLCSVSRIHHHHHDTAMMSSITSNDNDNNNNMNHAIDRNHDNNNENAISRKQDDLSGANDNDRSNTTMINNSRNDVANSSSTKSHNLFCCNYIVTSDVQDEYDDIYQNIQTNYQLNDISNPPMHIPHTWGTGWKKSYQKAIARQQSPHLVQEDPNNGNDTTDDDDTTAVVSMIPFDTIMASDILLYVSAYDDLVQTLHEIFTYHPHSTFIMSWNRRMKESIEFFYKMEIANFQYQHVGQCIYKFTKKQQL